MSRRPWSMGLRVGGDGLVGAILVAPVVALRHLRRRWWTRRPFLPTFSRSQLEWRRLTAYGSTGHRLESGDLIRYLAWVRRYGRATR